MKIKNSIRLTVAACMALTMTGCSDWLDVKPESEMILEDFWKSESDVECVLAGCYRGLTEDNIIYRMMVWGEVRSDNMTFGTGFPNERLDIYRILEGDITATNSYANWAPFYSIINYCNTVLHYAPIVIDRDENFTQFDLDRVNAEAYTLRALCYFYLVRTFKEVPWIGTPSISDSQNFNVPKSSEAAVLDSIIVDLEKARFSAADGFSSQEQTKGKITRNAVNALLADVYLWAGKYDKCIEACDRVLTDKKLLLVENEFMYTQVFYRGNSNESIFELQFDDKIQKNNPVINLYGTLGDSYGELTFPSNLAFDTEKGLPGLYSPFMYTIPGTTIKESEDDVRFKDSYNLNGGICFIFKYAGRNRELSPTGRSTYTYRSDTPNWIIYRLADIYLMRAEALASRGKSLDMPEAVCMVNKTYARANKGKDTLYVANYETQTKVLELVHRERQREFLFEGKRWFDLVRLAKRDGNTLNVNSIVDHKLSGASNSLGVTVMDGLYMPVYKYELESNPKMTQNPFYEEKSSSSTR